MKNKKILYYFCEPRPKPTQRPGILHLKPSTLNLKPYMPATLCQVMPSYANYPSPPPLFGLLCVSVCKPHWPNAGRLDG